MTADLDTIFMDFYLKSVHSSRSDLIIIDLNADFKQVKPKYHYPIAQIALDKVNHNTESTFETIEQYVWRKTHEQN